MKILSGMVGAVAAIALLAGPALAQEGPARYGEPDKDKTPTENAAERDGRDGPTSGRWQYTGAEEHGPLGDRARDSAGQGRQGCRPSKPKAKVRRYQAR